MLQEGSKWGQAPASPPQAVSSERNHFPGDPNGKRIACKVLFKQNYPNRLSSEQVSHGRHLGKVSLS